MPAATWGFAMVYRWICADREWVGNMADEGEENQTITFTSNQYGTVFLPQHRKLYPALSPRRRRMTLVSRSRTSFSGNGRNHIGAQSDLHKLHPSPIPYIKVLRSFFKSDRSPNYIPQSLPVEGG